MFGGGLTAAMSGVFVGLPSRRVKGIYLAVATIAAQFITEWVINHVDWIGGGASSSGRRAPRPRSDRSQRAQHPGSLLVRPRLLPCSRSSLGVNLARSRIGRAFVAIRDHDIAAEVIGIDVARYKLLAFAGELVLHGHHRGGLGELPRDRQLRDVHADGVHRVPRE